MTPEQIKERILQTYAGSTVEVADMTGGNDHYQVLVEAREFKGLSRIQQHKAVMDIFAGELKSGEIHAFTLKTVIKG